MKNTGLFRIVLVFICIIGILVSFSCGNDDGGGNSLNNSSGDNDYDASTEGTDGEDIEGPGVRQVAATGDGSGYCIRSFAITKKHSTTNGALVLTCINNFSRGYSFLIIDNGSAPAGMHEQGCRDDLLNMSDDLCQLIYDHRPLSQNTEVLVPGETNIPKQIARAVIEFYAYAYEEGWHMAVCSVPYG